MRQGFNNGWLTDEENIIGINLGADFCAEHEWGIKELREVLGIDNDENVMGIERYRTKNPKMEGIFLIEENKSNAALIAVEPFEVRWLVGRKLKDYRELGLAKGEELATAWSKKDFGIRVHRPVNVKKLKKIYNAIQNKEAAVWIGGGGVFQNAGLLIGLINQIPEHLKQQMYDSHVDAQKLKKASEKTGIKEKIDAFNAEYKKTHDILFDAPCDYYSLRPAWLKGVHKSNHPVMYWLNPREQKKNESGWYTVEDLEMWMEGKGPILKKVS
jgi:hypothetical protein